MQELSAAAVLRSNDLSHRLRLDLESDLGGGSAPSPAAAGRAASLCCTRASLEASQELGGSCLATATLGADLGTLRDPAVAWGLAIERRLTGGQTRNAPLTVGQDHQAPPPLRAKLCARLVCERRFGRQLLLQAQRVLGSSSWLDARYAVHACGGARRAALKCSVLGGCDSAGAVALTHRWRVGGDRGEGDGGGGDSSGRISGGRAGSSSSSGSVAAQHQVLKASVGSSSSSSSELAGSPLASGGISAGATSTGITSSGVLSGAGSSSSGVVALAAATAAAAAGSSTSSSSTVQTEPLTVSLPQPRWEVSTGCSFGGGGSWGWSLQFMVHRGERVFWDLLPGNVPMHFML